MEREIKFRGLDVNNEWIYGSRVFSIENESNLFMEIYGKNDGRLKAVKKESVGRFTGKRDVEGREVYEGDRLEYEGREVSDDNVVRYVHDGFWLNDKDGLFFPNKFMVAGNIHKPEKKDDFIQILKESYESVIRRLSKELDELYAENNKYFRISKDFPLRIALTVFFDYCNKKYGTDISTCIANYANNTQIKSKHKMENENEFRVNLNKNEITIDGTTYKIVRKNADSKEILCDICALSEQCDLMDGCLIGLFEIENKKDCYFVKMENKIPRDNKGRFFFEYVEKEGINKQ